jgi:DNA-directed RNA polymerase specialized sigma24 family protein
MTKPVSDELSSSICQLNNVSEQEAIRIWEEFFPRLKRYAQAHIRNMSLRVFDEEDVALSALNSFFRCSAEGRFDDLDGDEEMWRLLVTITARKITAERRRQLAAKRGGGDVRGESAFLGVGDSQITAGLSQIMDASLMPQSADAILESCRELLDALPNEQLRSTALMRMEGYSNKEISADLECSVARTKQRVAQIKKLWSKYMAG